MRKIYTIGETVLDILIKESQPFTAKAGGACLNTAVSLGRLGVPVQFIGEYGLDEVGNFIDNFLKTNNVSTDYVYRYYDGKSALALAFLNENNDASYDFYKIYPEKRLDVEFPHLHQDDIVLFGSFYAITTEVRKKLIHFIQEAKKRKAIIIYDPNFRKQHLHELPALKSMIAENIALATIVRGSHEDFSFVFGARNADETFKCFGEKPPCLLYTSSTKGVYLRTTKISEKFEVRKIIPKSTIGAGDNFNAGIVYSLYKNDVRYKDVCTLGIDKWADLIKTAVDFATHVCENYDNYLSADFAESYKLS
ncbi:MAG: carbohydrate kinase [Bacteroidales bacterium]|nr:carbohydrate kinase [Bacteroidales bacterium]